MEVKPCINVQSCKMAVHCTCVHSFIPIPFQLYYIICMSGIIR